MNTNIKKINTEHVIFLISGFGWHIKQMPKRFRKNKLRVSVIGEGVKIVLCLKRTVGAPGHVDIGRGSEDIDPYQADRICGE